MRSAEPRFARIAALIADPSRARMLAVLLSGECRSAGELAAVAGITPQACSTHLSQMVENGILSVQQRGRHKYHMLASADVAHLLEALSLVAERDAVHDRWDKPGYKPLKRARCCYGHMAGELAVAQFDMLKRCAHLHMGESGLELTASGRAWVCALVPGWPPTGRHRQAYACMDWSERREHLAGSLANTLLAAYLDKDWLRKVPDSRALRLTPLGERELLPLLGV
ncbi:ArsR/SmtB family transcription factor [Hydrogenophaga sp.]|uniref:ArsR/SmtB family transcription factor n=1 Tax=Hydrogenophaga sp. TaxID=1904254 RepID=UPI00356A6C35